MQKQVESVDEIAKQIQQIQVMLMSTHNLQTKKQQQNNPHTHIPINDLHKPIITTIQPILKVILNSLKLSKKLHDSILQKQAQIQLQTQTITTKSEQTQQKLNQTLKLTKQLYQQTIRQNQKSKFLFQQLITPLRQQLKSKVDETALSLQMRMILDEYDSMGHQVTYDLDEEEKLKQQQQKNLQSSTLNFLKDNILPLLSSLDNKLNTYEKSGLFMEKKLDDLSLKALKLQSELKFHHQMMQQHQLKTTSIIDQKVDENQVQIIINRLFPLLIQQNHHNLTNQLTKTHQFAKHLEANFTHEVQHIKNLVNTALKKQQNTQNSLLIYIEKDQKQFENENKLIEKHRLQIEMLHNQLKKHDQNSQLLHRLDKKFQNLQTKLQKGQFSKLSSQLNSQELQSIMQKLNQLKTQSKRVKKLQKQSQQKSHILKGQLQSIRDMLSRKANFSDILMHMQNKVDKHQFKEFKMQFEQFKQIKKDGMMIKQTQPQREIIHSSSSRKKHFRNRSFFGHSMVEKPTASSQLQVQEVKRFRLGFTNQLIPPDTAVKTHSKTQHLRLSIRDNSSLYYPIQQQSTQI